MKTMHKVKEVIVVEGRYDKAFLASFLDAVIVETRGFGLFSDKETLALLRRLAEARGLVVLTDSDGGGFVIRNYLKGVLRPELVKHAYIPDVMGKEKRKSSPSKEGKLGVEGMRPEVILEALRRAGATLDGEEGPARGKLTKADLFALGLSGAAGSAELRKKLLKRLELPEHLTPNAMLEVLNLLTDRESLQALISQIQEQ